MKYNKAKGVRFELLPVDKKQGEEVIKKAVLEKEIVLDEEYEYVDIHVLDCIPLQKIEVYINEEKCDYIELTLDKHLILSDIAIRKIKVKLGNIATDKDVIVQAILMR